MVSLFSIFEALTDMFEPHGCVARRRRLLSCCYSYLFHQVSLSDLLWLHYHVLCFCQLQLLSLFKTLSKRFPSNASSPLRVACVSLSLAASLCRNHKRTQAGSFTLGCVKMMSGQTASSSMSISSYSYCSA